MPPSCGRWKPMDNAVGIQRCADYGQQGLDRAVEALFDLLDFARLLPEQGTVVLKPNLILKRRPEEATTTHPGVVRAVVRALKARGVAGERILIADSPGGLYNAAVLRGIYQASGMAEVAGDEGVRLNDDFGSETVAYATGVRCRQFQIINPIRSAALIIDLPKLKTHAMTGFSGACKNLFGCVPGLIKPEMHCRFPDKPEFGEMLVDLCELVRPRISLADGIIGMEGNGPTGGNPRFAGILAASENPHALDLALCAMIGRTPQEITTLASAVARGLVPASVEELELRGDVPDPLLIADFRRPDSQSVDFVERLPGPLRAPVSRLLTPKPVIRTKTCIGCGKCAESCPQHTIRIVEKKARISYANCIKCYCCHEMCPVRAIDIRRFRLFDL